MYSQMSPAKSRTLNVKVPCYYLQCTTVVGIKKKDVVGEPVILDRGSIVVQLLLVQYFKAKIHAPVDPPD